MSDHDDHEFDQPGGPTATPTGRLIHLASAEAAQPEHLMLDMREYWQSLRKGRSVPARSDIDPKGIRRVLDYAFILERIAPGAARFRLAGRHLIELLGMEVRGMPACSVISASSRGRFSDVLETVFKAPQIAEFRLLSQAGYARPELDARMLLLPLKSDLGDVTRALGCLISQGETGVAPRRFDITDDRLDPVFEGGVIMEPSPSAVGFAESRRPFVPAGRRATPKAGPKDADPKAVQDGVRAGLPTAPAPEIEPETPEERRARFRVVVSNPD